MQTFVRKKQGFRGAKYLVKFSKILIFIYLCLLAFNIRYLSKNFGLDPSWDFAMNYFADKGFKFGSDVIWTYGPMGYLIGSMDIGSNLMQGIIFQLFLWIFFTGLLGYVILKLNVSLGRLFVFLILFECGHLVFYLGFSGLDYFISFITLMLFSLSLFVRRRFVPFFLALCFITAGLFIKFNSLLFNFSALGIYLLILFHENKNKGAMASGFALVFIPMSFAICYLLYNPSITGMSGYLKGMYEVARGYNSVMSLKGRMMDFYIVAGFGLLYALTMIVLYATRQKSFYLSIIFVGPFFAVFKHGFVRQDSHTVVFFSFVLLLFGIIILFTERRKGVVACSLIFSFAVAGWIMEYVYYYPPYTSFHE